MTPTLQTARTEEFLALLRARVKPKTFRHCVSTAEFMLEHADALPIDDHEEAVTTGLLHDLCKNLSAPDMLDTACRYGIAPTDVQRGNPGLLHGPVAAEECRRTLGISDDAVYEAVYWHTTGHRGMGALALALYLADFAEKCRSHPEAKEARDVLAAAGFHAALRFTARKKLEHVLTKSVVDPATEDFSHWVETLTH